MALQEGSPAFGEVKGPEPEKLVAHSEPLDSEGAIFEDLRPASQNFGVVATEVLEVDDDNVGRASQDSAGEPEGKGTPGKDRAPNEVGVLLRPFETPVPYDDCLQRCETVALERGPVQACTGRARRWVSEFFHDRRLRRDHRLFAREPPDAVEGESLLNWCAARMGVVTPLPSSGGD
jgi:hypothetical protein